MPNKDRKLASIQRIEEIRPIENADAIEVAKVLGWDVVVKKNEFNVGDTVVYFEIDSFLPISERFKFLESSYKKNNLVGEGYRLKTVKLRGQISQGLVMPISEFSEIGTDYKVGDDVTEKLGVKLYEAEVKMMGEGKIKRNFHPIIKKTDEIRCQSNPQYLEILKGHPYYITEKIDGTSITVVYENDTVRIFGRNVEHIESPESMVWKVFRNLGVIDTIKKSPKPIFIQGEFYGEGIQKNRLKIKGKDFKVFNVGNPLTGELYTFDEWNEVMEFDKDHVIKFVKVLEKGDNFNYNQDELQEISKGNYDNAGQREGIVIRSSDGLKMPNGENVSFKVINNKYLLKHGE